MFPGTINTQQLTIRNETDIDLKDMYLSYDGLEKKPFRIRLIPKRSQRINQLAVGHLHKESNLTLIYNEDNQEKRIVVYNKLVCTNHSNLLLIISMSQDNKIKAKMK